jgi:hypothetical protein
VAKDLPHLVIAGRKKSAKLALPGKGRGFALDRRGNLTLVRPDGKRDWDDSERIFRSLVFDRAGLPLSVGLPKFFSPFSDQAAAASLDAALASGAEASLERKYDGSLLIRSLLRGQPYFRTRNALDAESYDAPTRAVAAARYPALLDPTFAVGLSLHLEYVSPRTRVVLDYPEDDLVLLGAIENASLRLLSVAEVDELALAAGLRRPERVAAQAIGPTVAAIQAAADADAEHEGWVARWGDERLLRIKGRPYIEAFRRRFELNPERVFAAVDRKGDRAAVKRYLGLKEADALEGYVDELYDAYAGLNATVAAELDVLQSLLAEHAGLTRARLWRDVGATLEEPRGAALMHLRAREQDQARELLRQSLRKRLTL